MVAIIGLTSSANGKCGARQRTVIRRIQKSRKKLHTILLPPLTGARITSIFAHLSLVSSVSLSSLQLLLLHLPDSRQSRCWQACLSQAQKPLLRRSAQIPHPCPLKNLGISPSSTDARLASELHRRTFSFLPRLASPLWASILRVGLVRCWG